MTLIIFDLDNTLIGGDSDNLWGQFACQQGIVNGGDFEARNEQFYRDYQAGKLDVDAYLRFSFSTLQGQPASTLATWHLEFMETMITPIMLPAAQQLIEKHQAAGDTLLIITATNRFITEPIAKSLGIDNLLACEGEIVDGIYTGEPTGVPSYGAGKVTRLHQWLAKRDINLDGAWFYSDSHNDLPLLELVDNPVAVDPDSILCARAEQLGWPVISLRG